MRANNPKAKWARHTRTIEMRRARNPAVSPALRHCHVQNARHANRKLVAALVAGPQSAYARNADRIDGYDRDDLGLSNDY